MNLDDGENIIVEAKPDKQVLFVWFYSKTISYSMGTFLFIFMMLFFLNTFNLLSADNYQDQVTSVQQNDNTQNSKQQPGNGPEHPFQTMIDYWEWALVSVCLIGLLIQIYMVYLRNTFHYIITDRRCIFVGGILRRTERSVPYKKITDIQRTQNILERILGLWNVQVFTPGTASMQVGHMKARAELNFDGLKNSEELFKAINKYSQING